jgi:hypothetical protein
LDQSRAASFNRMREDNRRCLQRMPHRCSSCSRTVARCQYRFADAWAWNRKRPSDYEVVRIHFENGEPKSIEPLISGFLIQQSDGTGPLRATVGSRDWRGRQSAEGDEQNGIIYRIHAERNCATVLAAGMVAA